MDAIRQALGLAEAAPESAVLDAIDELYARVALIENVRYRHGLPPDADEKALLNELTLGREALDSMPERRLVARAIAEGRIPEGERDWWLRAARDVLIHPHGKPGAPYEDMIGPVLPHVWAAVDGDPAKGAVRTVEEALPLEIGYLHRDRAILWVRTLKREPAPEAKEGRAEANGAEEAPPAGMPEIEAPELSEDAAAA